MLTSPRSNTTQTMDTPATILQSWGYVAGGQSSSLVLPDGCRDLIIRTLPSGQWQYMVSDLDDQAYMVSSQCGECFRGYRFQPAARWDMQGLQCAMNSLDEPDEEAVLAIIADLVQVDQRVSEALDALSGSGNLTAASRKVGVSGRTLERLVVGQTGRTPSFWKALVRMRRAAKAIVDTSTQAGSLVEIAANHGYADQAHMNREFRRWLGVTPAQFRGNPALNQGLMPGYD